VNQSPLGRIAGFSRIQENCAGAAQRINDSIYFLRHFLPGSMYFAVMVPSAATRDAIRFQKVARTPLSVGYLRSTDNNSL
jgi:hypothetical protein